MARRSTEGYSSDFKNNVVQLVLDGKPVSQVSKEHALTKSIVYTWVAMYKRNGGFHDSDRNDVFELAAEVAKLRSENRRLAYENTLLKQM